MADCQTLRVNLSPGGEEICGDPGAAGAHQAPTLRRSATEGRSERTGSSVVHSEAVTFAGFVIQTMRA